MIMPKLNKIRLLKAKNLGKWIAFCPPIIDDTSECCFYKVTEEGVLNKAYYNADGGVDYDSIHIPEKITFKHLQRVNKEFRAAFAPRDFVDVYGTNI